LNCASVSLAEHGAPSALAQALDGRHHYTMTSSTTLIRRRPYHWLAVVPPLGMLGGVPFANRIRTLVHGWPFLLLWIVAWVILTAGCMALIYALDRRARAGESSHE
jgi:hypothetical protein